jgi:hypothetical protein
MRLVLSSALLCLVLSGCASAAGSGGGGGNPNLINSEHLREAEAEGVSAFQLIERLRSRWLRARGASSFTNEVSAPMVILDGVPYGEAITLQSMAVVDIGEIRFMNATDATTRFGTGYTGGAILVSRR